MSKKKSKSILAVTCGNVNTTAYLIERSKQGYRLKATSYAPSTHDAPWRDLTLAIQEAIRGLEAQSGRTLLTPGGRPITPQTSSQQGVDLFLAVSSAGEPLPLALVGLINDISLDSARRAATTIYTQLTAELSLDMERGSRARHMEHRLQALQQHPPEAILLVGGTDGGAKRPVTDMANLIAMAMHLLPEGSKPAVLYAGNIDMRPAVAEILGAHVTAVDNIRPDLTTENLAAPQLELERLYLQRKMSRLPQVETLNNWLSHPLMPTSKSFQKVITFLGQQDGLNVLGVDVGSRATSVAVEVQPSQYLTPYHGLTIRSDAGVGHSLGALLQLVPLAQFQRWLSFEIDPDDLYNQLLNKTLAPPSIPLSQDGLLIEYAMAREAMRLAVNQSRQGWPRFAELGQLDPQWNLIVGSGRALAAAPNPAHAALLLLDALEPWGMTRLALDQHGLTNVLGAIAVVEPMAAVQVILQDTFLNLGTVIAPAGHGTVGKTAVKIKITYADERTESLDVPYGIIQRLPLAADETAQVEIRPAYEFDIVPGYPGQGATAEVNGGVLGLIIDTRGRPLKLSPDDSTRHQQLQQWQEQITIDN